MPECAASYIPELSYALNHVSDPVQGCTTGITVGRERKRERERVTHCGYHDRERGRGVEGEEKRTDLRN